MFNVYTEHIMRNSGLDELQAGNKIGGRNIKLRYADGTTLMAETEDELKSLLIRVKESERAGLKLNIKKEKIMASGPIKLKVKKKVKFMSLRCVRLFATPSTAAYQDPLPMGFSRQEYWSGVPFPSPGDLSNSGIEAKSGPITSWQIEGKKMEVVTDFLFWGSKITADDCSHRIIRRLLLGRKAMTNLYSVLKSRDNTLPKKVHIVKAMVLPVVM